MKDYFYGANYLVVKIDENLGGYQKNLSMQFFFKINKNLKNEFSEFSQNIICWLVDHPVEAINQTKLRKTIEPFFHGTIFSQNNFSQNPFS